MKKKLIVLLGLVAAILIGMLMLALQGYDPLLSYWSILKYSLASEVGISNTLNRAAFLLMAGTSAAVALGSGVSNLGQFGQLLMGAMAATVIGLYIPAPSYIIIPLMIAGGMMAGALYAGIAAFAKKKFGMNEFITTLMMNFLANYFTQYLITNQLMDKTASWPASKVVPDAAILPAVGSLDTAAFLMIAVYIGVCFYLVKSKRGYEYQIMGKNSVFARVGGCDTDRNFVRIMLLSGAFAGLLGVMMIIGNGQQHRFITAIGKSYADDGLMMSIVAGNYAPGVFIYAIIFSILQSGSAGMQLDTGVPLEFITMLIAITVLCVVAFRSYFDIFLNRVAAIRKSMKLRKEAKNIGSAG